MTKKELRRLENLVSVKIDALAAWLLLKAICCHLGHEDHDELEGQVLNHIAQDLFNSLNSEGLVCDDGATGRLVEYVKLTNPPRLRLVKQGNK